VTGIVQSANSIDYRYYRKIIVGELRGGVFRFIRA
jgi:hypothetical protein